MRKQAYEVRATIQGRENTLVKRFFYKDEKTRRTANVKAGKLMEKYTDAYIEDVDVWS